MEKERSELLSSVSAPFSNYLMSTCACMDVFRVGFKATSGL